MHQAFSGSILYHLGMLSTLLRISHKNYHNYEEMNDKSNRMATEYTNVGGKST